MRVACVCQDPGAGERKAEGVRQSERVAKRPDEHLLRDGEGRGSR